MAATFLLLVAGVLVTAPGLMTASATGTSTPHAEDGNGGDDDGNDGYHDGGDDHDGDHDDDDDECVNPDDTSTTVDGEDDDEAENDDDNEAENDDEAEDQNQAEDDNFKATSIGVYNNNNDGDDHDGEDHDGDGDHDGDHHDDDDENCAVTTTIEAHKSLGNTYGGTMAPEDFTLLLDGQPITQFADNTVAPGPHAVTEQGEFGYALRDTVCTDQATDQPVSEDGTVDITAGQQISCEVVNDEIPPSITLVKNVITDDGGTAKKGDFTLTVNGDEVEQEVPFTGILANQVSVVSEVPRRGYTTASIECFSDIADSPNTKSIAQSDSLELTPVLGENIECLITNDDVAPTVTINKVVVGSDAAPESFQMLLGHVAAVQGHALPVMANTPIEVSEVDDPNFVRAVICVDADDPELAPLANPLNLLEGQNALCTVTNTRRDSRGLVDLSITKSDNGLQQIAGGDNFDYTITVENLGSSDPSAAATVTDQLPAGLAFVSWPDNCSPSGQTLTCLIDAAALQVGDEPVLMTVTVQANADAPSGTYTNLAFVDTPDDPISEPTCQTASNNVACETTDIRRQASITVDKEASVSTVSPGQSYSYTMTVANPGPSTFLANLTLTDDLPDGVHLDSVTPGEQWSCNDIDPLVCTFGANVQPGVTTPAVTIGVTLDAGFTGSVVINEATAIAIVDPPTAVQAAAIHAEATTSDPGTVVTATDDATTPVLRNADLAIDKTVSQNTVAPNGQFNWILDITNTGPNAATDVVVSDTLPAQFEVLAAFPPLGVNCTNSTTSVQCTASSLAIGAALHIVVQVRTVSGAAPGVVTNTASVSASSTDPNTANNTDSASIEITGAQSSPPTAPAVGSGAPTPQLPRTGNSSLGGPLTLASLLVATGMFSLMIARRRRAATR